MKKIVMALCAAAVLSGCTSETKFGPCVGFGESRDPKATYQISGWNAFVAFIFFETAVVPIVWALDDVYCPTGQK